MCCGTGICKAILFIFNFFFWLSGIAIAAIAVWVLVDPEMLKYIDLSDEIMNQGYVKYAIYIMIGVGVFVLMVGFFGCCGAIFESVWMLSIYATLLVVIFAAEIAFGVLALLFKNQIEDKIEKDGVKILSTRTNTDSLFTSLVHYTQAKLECCGLKDRQKDFDQNSFPWSCCKLRSNLTEKEDFQNLVVPGTEYFENYDNCWGIKESNFNGINSEAVWKDNCLQKLKDKADKNLLILVGVGIGIGAIQIIGFIIACFLCCSIRRKAKS